MITTNERQEKLIDQYGALINPSKARIMREAGLGIIEGRKEGAYVWDEEGIRYIDCRDDTCVFTVGRRNAELVGVLKEALDSYDLGNNLFFSEPRVHLAQRLGQISPHQALTAVAYGVSGGEIVDFAIKLARAITGRPKVISMKNAMHGSTGFAISASQDAEITSTFGPLMPDFIQIPFNDLGALRKALDGSTACVLLEPIQANAGVKIPSDGFLSSVRQLCTEAGALMIVDEIETGLGRTGRMFAVEHEDVVPDVITIGNALSGGLSPITAAVFKPEFLKFWDEHPFLHHSTFGGSDLGCIVGLAVIDLIQKKNLAQRADELGEMFAIGFEELSQKYPQVLKEFRHAGLMMAVEFKSDAIGPQMSRDLSQFGVLASYSVDNPRTMRLSPPLTLEKEDVEFILDSFDQALAGCHSIVVPMDPDVLSGLINTIRG
jgi:putrescine aminotransferase